MKRHAVPNPSDLPVARKDEALRLALESAEVGAWVWTVSTGEITDLANTAKLLGLDRIGSIDEFIDVLHPEDRRGVQVVVNEAKATGRVEAEYRVVLSDGSSRWLRVKGSLLQGIDGPPARMAGVIADTSDRNRAEDVRNRLAAIVDSSDDAIISKDLNGIVTSWNAGATHLFGWSPEEMIGRSILTIIPPEFQSEEPAILANLRNGKKIDHHETVRLHKDGSRVQVSLTISPIRDSSGKIVGGSKIAREIGERLRLQKAIIQSEKLAATGRMAAAIAHEINNPLEAVTNLAYLLSTDDTLGDRAKYYSKLLLEEISRISDVAKQSLGFFRDTKKPGQFDLCELLDSALSLYRPTLDKKGISLTRDFVGSCRVQGAAAEMRQVFANMIRNAIEATSPGGKIKVRVRTTRTGMRRILIADNGHGISPETKRHLFQPFVTSKGTAGNGLGLWVSEGIIRKHGGRISVRTCDVPGRSGTVFAILLPRETDGSSEADMPASRPELVLAHRLAS
jgi:PAS domain S-box-containing protein